MLVPAIKWLALPASLFFFLSFYEYTKVGLRRRGRGLRLFSYATCALFLLIAPLALWFPQWWPVPGLAMIVIGIPLAGSLILRFPEEPLARSPRSLLDEYNAKGLPYMKKRYAGCLYEAKGTNLRPISKNEEEGIWYCELDCGVSRGVDFAVWLTFELTEPHPGFWGQKPIRVQGRIESFEGYSVRLGRGKLFT